MSALEFFRAGRPGGDYMRGKGYRFANRRPRVECSDGFTVSVQASRHHYCDPRTDEGPWTHVEIGFPSVQPEPWAEWEPYCESPDRPTDTVYGHVPLEMVEALVALHGGDR